MRAASRFPRGWWLSPVRSTADHVRSAPAPSRIRITVLIAAATCATALPACGGSAAPTPHQASHDPLLAFSQCMRAHGVPRFPDPRVSGGGIQIQIGSGADPSSPAFQAAQAHCQKLMPAGGRPRGTPTAQDKRQMLAVSECMRRHGIPGFPDPTTAAPPGLSGINRYSLVIDRGGLTIALPKSIDPSSPAFQAASRTCGFGPGAHPPPKPKNP